MCLILSLSLIGIPALARAQDVQARLEDECEVSTIKPVNTATPSPLGLRVFPNGRISVGRATLASLIQLAFSVEQFQIIGGPNWIGRNVYDVTLLCPAYRNSSQSFAKGYSWQLSTAQRSALRDLLESRFNLKVTKSLHGGPVLILAKSSTASILKPTTKPDREPAMSVMQKGSMIDGEAFGINASMDDIAREFSADLQRIVVNETGILGSYDFHVLPFDGENTDIEFAVSGVARKLGLVLKKGTAAHPILKIEHASLPDLN